MEEVLHANIFFIITSVVTVCFGILVSVLLYHIIKIVQSVRRIVERVESGSERVVEEYEALRAQFNPVRIFTFISSLFPGPPVKRKRKSKE